MEFNSEGFNSQEMSCCRSPSPPSEPPHIGKWFSSYEYASPDVNFCKSILDLVPEVVKLTELRSFSDGKNEKREEDGGTFGRYSKQEMVHGCDKSSSVGPDDDGDLRLHIQHNRNMNQMNVDSLSPSSEPPDIKNWFSSYVYESPELDTFGCLKMSVFRDIQLADQENVINEKNDIAGLNEGRSPLESDYTNDVHYTDSVSLPSEPPDIRNWYSSYAYESPALFTDSELGLLNFKEIQCGECDESIVKRSGRKAKCDISKCFGTGDTISMHEKDVFTDLMPRHNHVDSGTSQGNCRVEEGGKNKNSDIFPILSDQIVEETQTPCINDSTSSIGKIVDRTDPPTLKNKTVSDLTESECSRKLYHGTSSITKCSNSESRSGEKVTSTNPVVPLINDPEKSSKFPQGQVDESTNRAEEENIQSAVAKNIFISTKKNLQTMLQKQQRPTEDRNHSGITKVQRSTMIVGSKRNVMSVVTNMKHSKEQEISGKWKCPQRIFNCSPDAHNVVAVYRAGYSKCSAPPRARVLKSGRDKVKLAKGQNYFICSISSHCDSGMKIAINAV